ncbi:MAG: CRISPR-associated protein Cas4 [Anaerolineae bacterium]|nr:CRISPR-associated protein Cas4 [Anaerolineae bacterium]MDW8100613.1 CRISPR-associated protein Cas4 [Anaerolineae bacterium]
MSAVLWGIAFLLIVTGALMLWWSSRISRAAGLPAGRVIYADTSRWWRVKTSIISRRWGLVGRPDYLVKHGREIIPVEVKSGPRPIHPHPSHLLQLAAYCLLVEDWASHRPSHGLLCYDDATLVVPFDDALRQAVLETLTELRRALTRVEVARSHQDPARCLGCGLRHACEQTLVSTG